MNWFTTVSLILMLGGCLVAIFSIIFSSRFGSQLEKIEIDRFGIKLEVHAATLFIGIGLTMAFMGVYLYRNNIYDMSTKVAQLSSDLKRQADDLGQYKEQLKTYVEASKEILCKFQLEIPDDLIHDKGVVFSYSLKNLSEENSSVKPEPKKLDVRLDTTFTTEAGTLVPVVIPRSELKLRPDQILTVEARKGNQTWRFMNFKPNSYCLKLMPVRSTQPGDR